MFICVSAKRLRPRIIDPYIGGLIGIKNFSDANDKDYNFVHGCGRTWPEYFPRDPRDHTDSAVGAERSSAYVSPCSGEAASRVCPMFSSITHPAATSRLLGRAREPAELAITMLSEELKILLPRFRPGDIGQILTYREVVSTLAQFSQRLNPTSSCLLSPCSAAVRDGNAPEPLYPEAVKEAIYAEPSLARLFTEKLPAGCLTRMPVRGSYSWGPSLTESQSRSM